MYAIKDIAGEISFIHEPSILVVHLKVITFFALYILQILPRLTAVILILYLPGYFCQGMIYSFLIASSSMHSRPIFAATSTYIYNYTFMRLKIICIYDILLYILLS